MKLLPHYMFSVSNESVCQVEVPLNGPQALDPARLLDHQFAATCATLYEQPFLEFSETERDACTYIYNIIYIVDFGINKNMS